MAVLPDEQLVQEQENELASLRQRQLELEEEVSTGKPGERMLMQIAKAQSSREGVIHVSVCRCVCMYIIYFLYMPLSSHPLEQAFFLVVHSITTPFAY
jgi:hypothetical protein